MSEELTRIGRLSGEDIYLHPERDALAIELIQSLYANNQQLKGELNELKAINGIYEAQLNDNSKPIIMPN